jgi:hypothetical protein
MRDACEHLEDVLTSRKMPRVWTQAHEDMMMEFIMLCTELRETRRTKEGLYFYRTFAQLTNPESLEKVCTLYAAAHIARDPLQHFVVCCCIGGSDRDLTPYFRRS